MEDEPDSALHPPKKMTPWEDRQNHAPSTLTERQRDRDIETETERVRERERESERERDNSALHRPKKMTPWADRQNHAPESLNLNSESKH